MKESQRQPHSEHESPPPRVQDFAMEFGQLTPMMEAGAATQAASWSASGLTRTIGSKKSVVKTSLRPISRFGRRDTTRRMCTPSALRPTQF